MNKIILEIEYPEDRPEIIEDLAKVLGHKPEFGDKGQFVADRAQQFMHGWFASMYKRTLNLPPPAPKDAGLGDTVARWIGYLAIPFKWIAMNCGCDARRKWLNKHFPYKNGNDNSNRDSSQR
jgi:hypothetical protein